MSVARGVEELAMHDDMLDCLKSFAALACDLIGSVLGEEPLGVFTCKCVACNELVESRVG
jgi:hypothetical protein